MFYLSEKEIEVIDNLLLFEIKEFTKHIMKIKCGQSFSSYFNPKDHMANVKHWIKKSIGVFRDERIRESEDLEINYVDDLEDYMIQCIKCYDEEIESLVKSQSKHYDQSVPNASVNTTTEDFTEKEFNKTEIEKDTENGLANEQEVPKDGDSYSTSHTEPLVLSVDVLLKS